MNSSAVPRVLIGLLVAMWLGLAAPALEAQTPSPATAVTAAKVTQALQSAGFTFTTHNAITWSVDLKRPNVGGLKVILSCDEDLVVVFVVLARKAGIQKTPQFFDALALANHTYDFSKVLLDPDGDLEVRIDLHPRLMDSKELKFAINQVADVSSEWYPKVSAFVSR